jgi:hypothetical protein
VLWPGPAGTAAKETITNDAVHLDSAVAERPVAHPPTAFCQQERDRLS